MKWEYKLETIYDTNKVILINEFNKWGEEGWEIVDVTWVNEDENIKYLACILKRSK